MKIRRAMPSEFDRIYMMGYDVWSDGNSENDYLYSCQTSPKYNKGSWYILDDGSQLLSSLIVYDFGESKFGIGSIGTLAILRGRGYASRLITGVIAEIENRSEGAILFLYSDIEPKFYEKFDFVKLPEAGQRYITTICMAEERTSIRFFQINWQLQNIFEQ